MYRNLKAEMTRNEVQRKDIADFLGIRYATVVDKINGKYQFKLEEAFSIKKRFFPNLSLEYLFAADESCSRKEVS